MIWSEKACVWQQELFTVRNNAVIFCSKGRSEYWLSYSYSVDEYIWIIAHMLRTYQSHQPGTSSIPSPNINLSQSALSWFITDPLSYHPIHTPVHPISPSDPPQLHLTLNTSIAFWSYPYLTCTFYRSDLLFILSESPSPEQQRLHDNLSHNPICCRLLFPVIFGSILLNSCDKILHHSERINRVFQRIFR